MTQASTPPAVRLARMLHPRSVAVIGESRTCAHVARATRRLGFDGPLVAVHPSGRSPAGPAVASVGELARHLPGGPDAAFVAVRNHAAVEVVGELAEIGCGSVVAYSSGFAETGPQGHALQQRLVEAAGSMPVLGPNCYGLINYARGVAIWPDVHGGRRLAPGERGVALVSQSSSVAISMTMHRTGVPLSYVLTVGNAAMLGAAALARALVGDPDVSAVGLLVESLADVRGLEALARDARRARVPVVALVLGRSEQARRVAISHSASMAGDAAIGSSFLHRIGIGQAHSVDALLATLSLLHCGGPLTGRALTSLSCSGGEAALLADAALGHDVRFDELTPTQRRELGAALGPKVALDNPLDYHTYVWTDRHAMARAFTAMVRGPADLNLLVCDLPSGMTPAHDAAGPGELEPIDDTDWVTSVEAFRDALAATGARGAVVAAMGSSLQGSRVADWVEEGLPSLAPPAVAMEAAAAAADIGAAWAAPEAEPVHGPRPPAQVPDPEPAGPAETAESVEQAEQPAQGPRLRVLDEAAGKALLRDHGIPVPPGSLCHTVAQAERIAATTPPPLVVKGAGVAHKSDADLVRLGLPDADAAVAAARDLLRRAPAVLIEHMVADPVVELLVGVDDDPTFGPVLTLGSGGVLAEIVRDITRVVLPVGRDELRRHLLSLRCAPLLAGYRGRPGVDVEAVLDAIVALAEAGAAHHLHALEVNPLLVTPHGAWAVDALVVVRQEPALDSTAQPTPQPTVQTPVHVTVPPDGSPT